MYYCPLIKRGLIWYKLHFINGKFTNVNDKNIIFDQLLYNRPVFGDAPGIRKSTHLPDTSMLGLPVTIPQVCSITCTHGIVFDIVYCLSPHTSYGRRSFQVASFELGNDLSQHVKSAKTLNQFKSALKTHLFSIH